MRSEGLGISMRPSDIFLNAPVPLTACFQKTEREVAAACIIATCRAFKDDFDHVCQPREIRLTLMAMKQVLPWAFNPFCPPDFHALAHRTFTRLSRTGMLSGLGRTGSGSRPRHLRFSKRRRIGGSDDAKKGCGDS